MENPIVSMFCTLATLLITVIPILSFGVNCTTIYTISRNFKRLAFLRKTLITTCLLATYYTVLNSYWYWNGQNESIGLVSDLLWALSELGFNLLVLRFVYIFVFHVRPLTKDCYDLPSACSTPK